jgi:hypothetical protein
MGSIKIIFVCSVMFLFVLDLPLQYFPFHLSSFAIEHRRFCLTPVDHLPAHSSSSLPCGLSPAGPPSRSFPSLFPFTHLVLRILVPTALT